MMDITTLDQAETELSKLIERTESTWLDIYTIISAVREKMLYLNYAKSFTQWVKLFSSRNKIHESYLWRLNKAGMVLDKFRNDGGDISNAKNINPEALVLAEQVGRGTQEEHNLIEQAVNGYINKRTLIEAKEQKKKNNKPRSYGATDATIRMTNMLCNPDIALWMYNIYHISGHYDTTTEFSIPSAFTAHDRRIDIMAVYVYGDRDTALTVAAHGIEVKSTVEDLKNDKKYIDYMPFCNAMWVAIPFKTFIWTDNTEIIKVAKEVVPENVGILGVNINADIAKCRQSIDDEEKPTAITIVRPAERQVMDTPHRALTMERITQHMMRRYAPVIGR